MEEITKTKKKNDGSHAFCPILWSHFVMLCFAIIMTVSFIPSVRFHPSSFFPSNLHICTTLQSPFLTKLINSAFATIIIDKKKLITILLKSKINNKDKNYKRKLTKNNNRNTKKGNKGNKKIIMIPNVYFHVVLCKASTLASN